MSSNKQIYSIDLVNSEGPLLKMIKSKKTFIIVDQWKVQIGVFYNRDEVMKFINGEVTLTDSKGRNWCYPIVSESMRVKTNDLLEFIKDQYTIDSEELYNKYMEWVDHVTKEADWVSTFGPKEIVEAIVNILEKNPELITKNR